MATNLLKYENHGVAESSDITATQVGHIYNVKAKADMDNGSFVKLDPTKFVEGDVWESTAPATTDAVMLVLTSVVIPEEYTIKCQEEANFYNASGDVVRAYELKPLDKFALSAACFTNPDAAAKGKYISMGGTGYKATVYSSPEDAAFVGYIYDVASNGNYRIIVVKNTPTA